MWKPQQPRWTWNTSKPLQKRSPLSIVTVQNIKRKHHLEPLSGALKTSGGTFSFKPLRLNIKLFFWNLWTFMFDLYLEPLCGTFLPWCGTLIRNLHVEPLRGNRYVKLFSATFMTNLFAKRLCGTFMWNFGNLNHSVEPFSGTLEPLWNLGTCKSGTFMWNLGEPEFLRVEPLCENLEKPELLRVEPLCGTSGTWTLRVEPWGTWTFKSGTCMWNLGEPEL